MTAGDNDAAPVTAKNVDFSNCDRELVQFPGAIQPHGVLLVVSEPDYLILQASANCGDLLGIAPEALLGRPIADVLGTKESEFFDRIASLSLDHTPVHVSREFFTGSARGVNVFAHRCDGVLIIEVEFIAEELGTSGGSLYSDVRETIARLQSTSGLQDFFDLAVERNRAFSGYDRVMAYMFAEVGSGHVIAEA